MKNLSPIIDPEDIVNKDYVDKGLAKKQEVGDYALKSEVPTSPEELGALPISGGTMEGPIVLANGDGRGILMPKSSNINVEGTSDTILGFVGENYVIGNGSYPTEIRGTKMDIFSAGNSGVTLKSVTSSKDYTQLNTTDGRVLFIQPNSAGTVNIGSAIDSVSEGDLSAKLIVGGDIKENGKMLSEKYQAKGEYATKSDLNAAIGEAMRGAY